MEDLARQPSIDNHSGRSKRIAFSTLMFALTLVLVSAASSAARLHGRVKHGIYQSPAKNFTVAIPQGTGMRIDDGYRKESDSETGAVSFHDDWGTLVAIHYDSVPPAGIAILEVMVAQVKIPGGSSMVTLDAAGEHRLDSTRGLVIFHRGRFVYMLCTELQGMAQTLGSDSEQKTGTSENAGNSGDQWMKFVDTLKPLYQSIEFLE